MAQTFTTRLLALLLTTLLPASAFAHAVHVDCKLVGATVRVEVYYDDDTPGAKANVEVRDGQETVIAKGVTDNQGKWSFAAPPPGEYVVHADAGAGHRARRQITVPDPAQPYPSAENTPTPEKTPTPLKSESITEGPSKEVATSTPWLKIAIGLIVIAACSGAFVLAMRLRRSAIGSSEPRTE